MLKVDSKEVSKLAFKLESLNKSALPLTVRRTLNNAAFENRSIDLEKSASKNFVRRDKNFFRVISKYEKAKGFDIEKMESRVGFVSKKQDDSAFNMQAQEFGGNVGGRDYLPTKESRVSRSNEKKVNKKYRLSTIKNKIISESNIKAVSSHQKFTIAAKKAEKANKLLKTKDGIFDKKGKGFVKIYDYKKNRKINLKSRNFLLEASMYTRQRIPLLFLKNGKELIKKVWM